MKHSAGDDRSTDVSLSDCLVVDVAVKVTNKASTRFNKIGKTVSIGMLSLSFIK